MSRNLSDIAVQALFNQETTESFVPLILLNHPQMPQPFRVAGSRSDVISNDTFGFNQTYYAYPFSIQLPDEKEDRPPEVSIILDNVDKRLVDFLRTPARGSPTVTLTIVLESSPTTIEAGPFEFTLRSVEWNRLTIRGVLSYEQILDEPYPAGTFNPAEFPGLFQ